MFVCGMASISCFSNRLAILGDMIGTAMRFIEVKCLSCRDFVNRRNLQKTANKLACFVPNISQCKF